MKNLIRNNVLLLLAIVLISAKAFSQTQMNLPVNFDSSSVNYGLVGFGGAEASSVITDPSVPTNKVAKVIKSATAELWAGTTVTAVTSNVQTGFSSKIPFTVTDTKMNVRVYSPNAGIKIRLKVEDYLDGTKSVETEATSTVANAWETLTFDFATQASGTAALNLAYNYNKVSIFFNFGVTGATAGEKTYYFDDVKFGAAPVVLQLPVLPLDFESTVIDYTFTNFDGGGATKITNPYKSGIDTSANVGKMVKSAGQTWGGSWISMIAPMDFSVNKIFKVKVYMPKVGSKMTLKVENATNAGFNYEKEVVGTVANAWEELTFDYSAIDTSKQYNHLVIIFDNGTMGDGSANFTYLFDDVRLTSAQPVLSQMTLPVTFDSSSVNYGLVGFGGAEASSVITDPSVPTNKVAKVIKSATAELWAGTTVTAVTSNVQTGFSSKIPFTVTDTKMNVRVYSPNAGIKIRLKVEDYLDGTKSVETEATSTVANAWETLTFDFATQASGTAALNLAYNYNKVSIFFNFGVTGATAGEKTYYFDDVKFGAAPVVLQLPVLPLDFESTVIDYTFTNFDGGGATKITNPYKSGIDTSANVGKMVKSAGQTWGGSWISMIAPMDFSVNKIFKVKVYMPKVGSKMLLKVENQTDAAVSYEKEVVGTVANAWEELTIDYSAIDTSKKYQKLVLIFDNGTMGDGSANFTYLFDDVTLVPKPLVLPLDFETAMVNYTFTNFDGGATTKITNPHKSGIDTSANVGKMVKSAGQTWGGSYISLTSPMDFSAKKIFKVKVYMPKVGSKMLLKVENQTDGAVSYEKEVVGTVANAWEELTFDYSTIDTSKKYQKLVVIFDNGTMGDGSANFTYLFDDVTLTAATPPPSVVRMGVTLTTSKIQTTVTNVGHIGGLNDFQDKVGVKFAGMERLFEGSFIFTTDSAHVSNAWRNRLGNYSPGFRPLKNITISTVGTTIRTETMYDDSNQVRPLGIAVIEKTLVDTNAAKPGYVFVQLGVVNKTSAKISKLRVGAFLDFDMTAAGSTDRGGIIRDSTNVITGVNSGNPFKMHVAYEQESGVNTAFLGIVPLSQGQLSGGRISSGAAEIYPTGVAFTDSIKNNFVSTFRTTNMFTDNGKSDDQSIIASVGPYDINAKDTAKAAFAVISGTSLGDLIATARLAQKDYFALGNPFGPVTTVARTETPSAFTLEQNFPNPFNPSTIIRFALPNTSRVLLKVYDMLGREVRTLISGDVAAGLNSVEWNGRNNLGQSVSTGVYIYRIEAEKFVSTRKMLLMK